MKRKSIMNSNALRNNNSSSLSTKDLFEVEKIIGKRKINSIIQYKTKWKDYPLSQSTWEPREHFESCDDIIDKYEKRLLRENLTNPKPIQEGKLVKSKSNLLIDLTQNSESNANTEETECFSLDFEILSIETVVQKHDGVYAYVKASCRDKEFIAKINTKMFYTYQSDLLIKYYESKLAFEK